jgi:hypothetical protein
VAHYSIQGLLISAQPACPSEYPLFTGAAAQTIVLKCGPKGVPFRMEKSKTTEDFELVLYTSLVTMVELSTSEGCAPPEATVVISTLDDGRRYVILEDCMRVKAFLQARFALLQPARSLHACRGCVCLWPVLHSGAWLLRRALHPEPASSFLRLHSPT